MKETTVLLAMICGGLSYHTAAADPATRPSPRGDKKEVMVVAAAAPVATTKIVERVKTHAATTPVAAPGPAAIAEGSASHHDSSAPTNAPPERGPQEPFAPVKSSLVSAPKDHLAAERGTYAGLFYDLLKVPSVYDLLDLTKPIEEEEFEANTPHDLLTGKPNGICLFKIRFGRQ